MSKALAQFRRLMDLSIDGVIDCYRRGGAAKRAITINVRDMGVERVTLKLRQTVEQYGKSIKVRVTYSAITRAFHFDIDLDHVVMTAEQATKYTDILKARREAA